MHAATRRAAVRATGLFRATPVVYDDAPPEWETKIPYWRQQRPEGESNRQMPPWLPDDSQRDPNVKYTEEEMQVRYGQMPDQRFLRRGEYINVGTVPRDMYTYGQEGTTVKCAIFKDQKDPVVRPIHEYPFIWHFLSGFAMNRTVEDYDAMERDGTMTPSVRAHREWCRSGEYEQMRTKFRSGPQAPKKVNESRGGKK